VLAPEQVQVQVRVQVREPTGSLFLLSSMREVWRTAHDLVQP